MPYIDFKGKKIFYLIKETNEARLNNRDIIFIHGSGGVSLIWQNQLESINLKYKLLAVDLPSHGKSDDISGITLDLYIEVIEKLKESLKLDKIILCGHSLGGAIALSYYFKNPDDIESLILCSTGARLRVSPKIFQHLSEGTKQYLNYIQPVLFHNKTPKSIVKIFLNQFSIVNPQVTHNDFQICDSFDRMKEMDLINVPCLILCGDEDKLTPVKYSQYFDEHIKNSRLHVIKNAGHMVMLEQPELVNQFIQEFIETL